MQPIRFDDKSVTSSIESSKKLENQTEIKYSAIKPIEKIKSSEVAKNEQQKPATFRPEAVNLLKKATGFSLMAIGALGAIVLFPVILPLGYLGLGVGIVVGNFIAKAFENHRNVKLTDAAKQDIIFGSIAGGVTAGTLLTAGLFGLGYKMVSDAYKENPQPTVKQQLNNPASISKLGIEIILEEVLPESEIAENSVSTLYGSGKKFVVGEDSDDEYFSLSFSDEGDGEGSISGENPSEVVEQVKVQEFVAEVNVPEKKAVEDLESSSDAEELFSSEGSVEEKKIVETSGRYSAEMGLRDDLIYIQALAATPFEGSRRLAEDEKPIFISTLNESGQVSEDFKKDLLWQLELNVDEYHFKSEIDKFKELSSNEGMSVKDFKEMRQKLELRLEDFANRNKIEESFFSYAKKELEELKKLEPNKVVNELKNEGKFDKAGIKEKIKALKNDKENLEKGLYKSEKSELKNIKLEFKRNKSKDQI